MGVVKLSTAGILDYSKTSNFLSGNAPYSPYVSAYDLLETQLLTSSATYVDFTGLGSLSDYKHLQVRVTTRNDRSSSSSASYITINSDTGSNYASHAISGNGSTVYLSAVSSQAQAQYGQMAGATAPTDTFSSAVIDILDFNDASKNTTIKSLSGHPGSTNLIQLWSAAWFNTNAVTSLRFWHYLGDSIAGSRYSLYGIKG